MLTFRKTVSSFAVPVCLALVTGCGAARTVAATQPGSPAGFDATKSDPKAVAIADEVLAAAGGADAWAKVKELRWTTSIYDADKVVLKVEHAWDRWNGRAYMKNQPQVEGASPTAAMYELYTDTEAALVFSDNGRRERANAGTTKEIIAIARKRWNMDHFWVSMHLKLKDPGAHLKYVEERIAEGSTTSEMAYDVIQVKFDPGVGPTPGDVYYLIVDKKTHLPHSVEIVETGKPDDRRVGYKWLDWVDAGGVKFATTRQNIGLASEKFTFTEVQALPSPDDDLYSPPVGLE